MKVSQLRQVIREEISKVLNKNVELKHKDLVQRIPNVAFDNYLEDPNYFYGYVFSIPTESNPYYKIKVEYPENKKGQIVKAQRYELISKKL